MSTHWMIQCKNRLKHVYDKQKDFPVLSDETRTEIVKTMIQATMETTAVDNQRRKPEKGRKETPGELQVREFVFSYDDYDVLSDEMLEEYYQMAHKQLRRYLLKITDVSQILFNDDLYDDFMDFFTSSRYQKTKEKFMKTWEASIFESCVEEDGSFNLAYIAKMEAEMASIEMRMFDAYILILLSQIRADVLQTAYETTTDRFLYDLGFFVELFNGFMEEKEAQAQIMAEEIQNDLYEECFDMITSTFEELQEDMDEDELDPDFVANLLA